MTLVLHVVGVIVVIGLLWAVAFVNINKGRIDK